jgi:hypothetical protein
MSALIDENYLRDTFNIHKDVKPSRITPYINPASRRLKKWVGLEVYGTSDNELKEALRLAEATLTMHFFIRNLNTNIRPKGLVGTETVEGNVTVRYLNETEITAAEANYLAQAEELIREFIVAPDIPPSLEVV